MVTVHCLGGLSRTAWIVDGTVSLDTGPGPGLVSSTGVTEGEAPATPLTPNILIITLNNQSQSELKILTVSAGLCALLRSPVVAGSVRAGSVSPIMCPGTPGIAVI